MIRSNCIELLCNGTPPWFNSYTFNATWRQLLQSSTLCCHPLVMTAKGRFRPDVQTANVRGRSANCLRLVRGLSDSACPPGGNWEIGHSEESADCSLGMNWACAFVAVVSVVCVVPQFIELINVTDTCNALCNTKRLYW
jgi:hypothetical protein